MVSGPGSRLRRSLSLLLPALAAARPAALAFLLFAAAAAGGAQGVSHFPDPTVTFSTPGVKTVTLTACNAAGCSSTTRQITVLDPAPVVTAFSVSPARAEIGATLLLEAAATGQPALSFSWLVLQGGVLQAILPGAHAAWSTAGAAPGLYTLRLLVSNAGGTAEADGDVLLVPGATCELFTVPPCRLLDTRSSAPLRSGAPPLAIAIGGRCGVPAAARAVVAHLTVAAPSAPGFLSVYPGDYSHFLVSSVNFGTGATRGNTLVLPLSTDGAGRLAAGVFLASPGTAELLIDTVGYFAPGGAAGPAPLAFAARLCPFGFCELATGTRIFFTEAFSSSGPALYRYDWLGTGAFDPPTPTPITSHVYDAPGFYFPAVEVTAGGSTATLQAAAPLFINPAAPAALPTAPAGVSAAFAGFASFSTVDPTLSGPFPTYRVTASAAPVDLLGYNVYVSKNGAPYRLVAALLPASVGGEAVPVEPFTPPADGEQLVVTAVNFAGEGAPSAAVGLSHP